LAAAYQLERLHDEFDFANTAIAELDVVVQIPAQHLTLDEALHVAQRLEYPEIQIASIHERADRGAKQLAVGGLVGDCAPSVSPLSRYNGTRSMSEEKFSSPPPSLPTATMISCCASPAALRGWP